ncbi:hypothetical protein [Ruminococcus sp. YE282]|uniref:hypothetical protein n=1 Tax=Ruminococcus sp. YE282 TaxID=3158780 RepID=UPI000B826EA5
MDINKTLEDIDNPSHTIIQQGFPALTISSKIFFINEWCKDQVNLFYEISKPQTFFTIYDRIARKIHLTF